MVDEQTDLGREIEEPEDFDRCRVLLFLVQLEEFGVFEEADRVPDDAASYGRGRNEA